jgi:ABC-type lipoprotein export system ATPase subunit
MDTATSGSIAVDGMELSGASETKLADYRRQKIGFVFQAYYLLPNLSAKQNLDLISEIAKEPLKTKEVLEMVGMQGRAKNRPSQLSGGQQQRISIARAVVKNPKLILADEPTAALDYKTSIDVLEVFENIVKRRISTVILITHNSEIAKMADRVIKISDGRIADITVNMNPQAARELKW